MKDEYDFFQSIPNPYVKKLKKQVTIRLDESPATAAGVGRRSRRGSLLGGSPPGRRHRFG
jgi:hypothetical protein